MFGSVRPFSNGWRRLHTLILAAGILITAVRADAAFILDDFDDLSIATSPEMENQLVVTENVGMLGASRRIGTGGVATDPNGQIDSGYSLPSTLTAALHGHLRTSTLTPTISFVFRYDFTERDVTEAGKINALLFDFSSITGTGQPPFFRSFVTESSQPNVIYESGAAIPATSGPITIAVPFSSFHFRSSSLGAANFQSLTSASFDFFFLAAPEDVEWSIQLDRIRFGAIPEPSTGELILIIGIVLASIRRSVVGARNAIISVGGNEKWCEESSLFLLLSQPR